MGSSPLVDIGEYLLFGVSLIGALAWYVYLAIVVAVAGLVLARYLTNYLNPFGSFAYRLARPAGVLLANMRNTGLYYPLRKVLKFDPAPLMLIVGTVLACYFLSVLVSYCLVFVAGLGRSLIAFGNGHTGEGARYLIGTALFGGLLYLLFLIMVIVVNWLFGLLSRSAYRSRERIWPLVRVFDRGPFAGWGLLVFGISLSIAAALIQQLLLS